MALCLKIRRIVRNFTGLALSNIYKNYSEVSQFLWRRHRICAIDAPDFWPEVYIYVVSYTAAAHNSPERRSDFGTLLSSIDLFFFGKIY